MKSRWNPGISSVITGPQLVRYASAELALALAPVAAVSPGTHGTAVMWWANPIPDGFLHHGAKGFSEAPAFGANLISLLHHLYRLGFGDRVQATQAARAGRNHRVGCTGGAASVR